MQGSDAVVAAIERGPTMSEKPTIHADPWQSPWELTGPPSPWASPEPRRAWGETPNPRTPGEPECFPLDDLRVIRSASERPPAGAYEGLWHGAIVRWLVGAKRYQATAPEIKEQPTICVVLVKPGERIQVRA